MEVRKILKVMRLICLLVMLLATATAALACGGDTDGPRVIELTTRDTAYSLDSITIKKDEQVTLRIKNEDAVEHDIQVDDLTVEKLSNAGSHDHSTKPGQLHFHVDAGPTGELTFRATTAGTYEYYCTVEGHRDLGMHGTLTIE
ncbi:MAG: cupredoxin domain-containing protein [Acidimicrobiales bacterium]|nr:cupredoxin domain-containing protein [Acidimicrobiales bacterium]